MDDELDVVQEAIINCVIRNINDDNFVKWLCELLFPVGQESEFKLTD